MNLYQQQIQYIFNRPIEEPPWYWQSRDEADPFGEEEDAMTAFLFYEQLCPKTRRPFVGLCKVRTDEDDFVKH